MTRYGSVELASQYTAQVWWIIWQPECDMFCMLVLLHLCMLCSLSRSDIQIHSFNVRIDICHKAQISLWLQIVFPVTECM